MTNQDILYETYSALKSNKIRTVLTMLGIVIGISSVIAMVAIGNGAKSSIETSIQSIGSNLVIVTPGAQRSFGGPSTGRGNAQTLTNEDGEAIAKIPNISATALVVSSRQQVVATGTNTNTNIIGTNANYSIARNLAISDGSFITDQMVAGSTKSAVIGPTVRNDLFGADADAVGQSLRIKGVIFKVVGVTVAKGGTGFSNPDDSIYIPYTTAQRYFTGNKYLTEIDVSALNAESTSEIQASITELLLERHDIDDVTKADFSTLNQSDIIATASSVTDTFTILLGAVAGISLVVGGIGIMNMMLTTVTERTREIGLRKAIGAKKSDIRTQFLIEAIVLTFIGGLIGVILGWSISFAVTKLGVLQTTVTLSSVLLAFGVSAFIGIVFGYYPARRASNLNPIEALRYE